MSQTRTIQRAMSRRSMLKLVGGSGLALAATACAAAAPAAPTAAPATAAPVVPTAVPAKPVTTVDWWTVTSADIGSQAQQEALIAEFNKLSAKTGAMVKPTFLPDDGFSEKMTTVLGTGTGVPDVCIVRPSLWNKGVAGVECAGFLDPNLLAAKADIAWREGGEVNK